MAGELCVLCYRIARLMQAIRQQLESAWYLFEKSRSHLVGKNLDEIKLPPDTFIVAIVARDGSLKSLIGDTLVQVHDEVVAITVGDQAEALLEVLSTEG